MKLFENKNISSKYYGYNDSNVDEIIEKMKEVVVCEEQSEETEEQDSQYANVFAKIFGEEPKEKNMVGDYDPTDMLVGCKLRTRR